MLTAATIKYLQSLRLGKFRQKYNKFIAEGDKCCIEFLKAQKYNVHTIYAYDEWIDLHSDILDAYSSKLVSIDHKQMKKISQLKTPSQVLLLCDYDNLDIKHSLKETATLYLDGIQNPGNLGTIIRTADWYGLSQIVCSNDTVDYYHPKVVQAAMGSHNNIDCYNMTLADLKSVTEMLILGTALDGKAIIRNSQFDPCILVIGNEGKGIRSENMKYIDRKILIEGAKGKIAESLNAGIATAIVLDRLFG